MIESDHPHTSCKHTLYLQFSRDWQSVVFDTCLITGCGEVAFCGYRYGDVD